MPDVFEILKINPCSSVSWNYIAILSYFDEILILSPIQQAAKHDQEKLSAELN